MMKLNLGLIADYADVTRAGKLVIGGEFDSVFSTSAGVDLAAASLVVRIDAEEKPGIQHRVSIAIDGPDGSVIAPMSPPQNAVFSAALLEGVSRGSIIFALRGLRLPAHGIYRIGVFVDDARIGEIPFRVGPRVAQA